jgi:hypothetical protein
VTEKMALSPSPTIHNNPTTQTHIEWNPISVVERVWIFLPIEFYTTACETGWFSLSTTATALASTFERIFELGSGLVEKIGLASVLDLQEREQDNELLCKLWLLCIVIPITIIKGMKGNWGILFRIQSPLPLHDSLCGWREKEV